MRYTPRGGTVTLLVTKEKQDFILRVTDTGPGFTPEALAKAGEMLYTDAARSDAAHQGLGLLFCTKSRAIPRRCVGFIQPSRCARCLCRAAPADLRIVLDVGFALC